LLFQGSVKDLEAISQPLIRIETDNTVDAANLLTRKNYIVADVTDEYIYVPYNSKDQMGNINTLLTQNGYIVFSITKQQKDLEELFLSITQNA
jgi:hypothetical protein